VPFTGMVCASAAMQHGQAGDDAARGARHLGGVLAGREPGAGVLVAVERDHADPQQGETFRSPVSPDCGYVQVRRSGRFAWYKVADPRVADLVMLARSLAADNAAALADCAASPRTPPRRARRGRDRAGLMTGGGSSQRPGGAAGLHRCSWRPAGYSRRLASTA
jgi:hypothetical protein